MTAADTALEIAGPSALAGLERDGEAARDFARESLSPETRRAYQTDVDVFVAWCRERGNEAFGRCLPSPRWSRRSWREAERGLRASTVARRASGIRLLHRAAGHETPTSSEVVRSTLKGIRRSLGVAPRQKAPATVEVVLDMVQQVPDDLRGIRDRALLLFAFATACRRSELSALQASDLTEVPQGFSVVIRSSKGDQEGEGQEIAVVRGKRACPVAALKRWLDAGGITSGAVFRRMRRGGVVLDDALRPQGIAQAVKHYAALAGYDPADFSGHSLRPAS